MNLALTRLYVFVQCLAAGWRDDERGQGLTEYALIIALIAVVCIVAVLALGTQISTLFTKVTNCLSSSSSTACSGL
jgi:pilus assembly protein Flp/PilA